LKKDKPMKKVYFFYLTFVLTILISTIVIGQVVVFEDSFESYTSGQQLACQNPTVWTTWTGNPCNLTEDAYVSNAYSFSGNNSVVIKQYNDIVRDHGLLTSGICEINFQMFIPTGKAGYFNTLADFAPPNYVWAMQVFFNSSGTGTLDAAGQNAAAFSYPQNCWIPVKVVADLVIDRGEFWLNGVLIHSWQWSKGTFGSPTIPLQLDGTDFYGYSTNDQMYIDDYNIAHFTYSSKISSTPTGGNWTSSSTWVGGVVPDSNNPIEIVSTASVNLDNNIIRDAKTLINGKLNCRTYTISGASDFILSSNATLEIGSSSGISSSGATGNIQVTGMRLLNPMANYVYNGSAAQVTGNGLPSTINNLTINNSSGLTLSSSTSVSGVLNLENGSLKTEINYISLGTSVSNVGTLVRTSGKVIGNFRRWFSNLVVANVLFPIGTLTNYYPANISFSTAPTIGGTLTAFFTESDPGGVGLPLDDEGTAVNNQGTNGYWTINANSLTGGIYSLDLTAENFEGVSDYVVLRIIKRNTGGSWILDGTHSAGTGNNSVPVVHRIGMTGFSEFGIANVDDPLPVELSLFTASIIGKNVKLSWQTETEVNNYGFEVQKSVAGRQNTEWQIMGFVNGNGNSNSPKNYSFIDDQISTGKYFYRLKQLDNDGKFEYSSIVEIDIRNSTEYSLEQNYPNPFNPNTIIKFTIPEAGNVKIKLFNLLGEEIQTLVDEIKTAGTHLINFNAQNLNSGVYLYKIETGTFTQVYKMTLIK
jgi:hypothetical protein